ncbi:Major facilitator superfamily domain, general substrate transporter [Cordyceps fumosorosea ARSEF 2679]|uniref:Major facilitator superfamily domain, general substrate transporter n=1 Tax=Cordyceps fumosorosea (strain ARSEF 2679) TaxID=1081104 RepID=A0A166XVH4_CORFA|nr:Major facilitator superfamily domain, general substrate transporter [Cordyceps fumosorosea ARSEF 2679]OAA36227.1 Major facilitator superfamily domain, general substrate transporter [Cordyceps fumosorosea ARSEF 2679]
MPFKLFPLIRGEPGPPPDGGVSAWLQILASHLINALSWGYSASFGVYQLHYTTTLSLPESQVAWIGSVQVFLTFFLGAFAGRAADAGLAWHAAVLGCLLVVLGTFTTSLATEYWQIFLAQGLCIGLGMGACYVPSMAVVGSYWQQHKAFAIGLAASGSGTGSILFTLVIQHLQPTIGFASAVRVQGYISLVFAVVVVVVFRPRLPPRKAGPIVEWKAFTEPTYVLFTIGVVLIFAAVYFCFFFINTYATLRVGLSPEAAANLLVIISAIGIPVRPLLGYLADRYFGSLLTLIVSTVFLAIMLFVWIAVRTESGLYVYSAFYGVATGAVQGMFVSGLASLTVDLSKLGVRFGMVDSLIAFASLAGPPLAGALIQIDNGGYLKAQIWAGVVTMCASFFICGAKWTQVKSNASRSRAREREATPNSLEAVRVEG